VASSDVRHPRIEPLVRRERVGYVQIAIAAALFGFNATVSKVVLSAGIEPARLSALRCTGTALALGLFLGVHDRSRFRVARRDIPVLVVLGLTGAALIQWLYFVAIDRLPVGVGLMLEFSSPLLVALYSHVVLRELLGRRIWLALGLCFGGLALVAQVWKDAGLDPIGVAAGLGAAVCLATFYLVGKNTLPRYDPFTVAFWMFAVAAIFWAVVQPWSSFDPSILDVSTPLLGSLQHVEVPMWAAVAWVVVLGTLVPYALEVSALRHLRPTVTGILGMSEPVLAAGVAWLWLGQALVGIQVVGGLLVLVGAAVVQLAGSSPGAQAEFAAV
jgi:drug/metabolite transporter (DMT)-like permease